MIFLFLLWTGWKTITLCLPLLVFNVKPVIGSGDLSVLNHPEATVATWLLWFGRGQECSPSYVTNQQFSLSWFGCGAEWILFFLRKILFRTFAFMS